MAQQLLCEYVSKRGIFNSVEQLLKHFTCSEDEIEEEDSNQGLSI